MLVGSMSASRDKHHSFETDFIQPLLASHLALKIKETHDALIPKMFTRKAAAFGTKNKPEDNSAVFTRQVYDGYKGFMHFL